jgi:peroxiredoxin
VRTTLTADLTVLDSHGHEDRLLDLCKDRSVVLVFLRHFGCVHCNDTAAHLRDRLDEVHSEGAELVFIGNGSADQAAAFARDRVPGCPVYTDPSLTTYQALGMTRSVRATLGLRSVLAGARATLQGHRQASLQGDPWQQGGMFVVARGGKVVYSQLNRSAADRPDLDAALQIAREVRSEGP